MDLAIYFISFRWIMDSGVRSNSRPEESITWNQRLIAPAGSMVNIREMAPIVNQSLLSTVYGLEVIIMKIKEDIKPISNLKSRSADLIAQINETHRPVIITQNGDPRAVIQDAESYQRTMNSLNLMKILAHGEKALKTGDTINQDDLFREIDNSLLKRKTAG